MTDLSKRIADLSPEKRKLLEQLLEGAGVSPPAPQSAPEGRKPVTNKKKEQTRRFYNSINQELDSAIFGAYSAFLNYGYVADETRQYSRVELPDLSLNKNSVKLVLEVIGDCDIADCKLLDIGCGRGGTIDVINKYFNASQTIGIDLSSSAILFCKQNYDEPRACFLEADSEALPFGGDAFDVVTNVESSHSYPSITGFYQEVLRVLKTGGYFLYTDLLPTKRARECLKDLREIGFILERDRDITNNVLLSCDETARLRLGAFAEDQDPDVINEFLSVPGSQVYMDMKNGKLTYKIFRLKKA